MTNRSKSAKKGWHTRRVKNRYDEIQKLINKDEGLIKTLDHNKDLFKEVQDSTESMIKMRLEYDAIMQKIGKELNLMESLPVESLTDSLECDKNGRPSKARYGDFIRAGSIRREGIAETDSKIKLAHEAQVAQMDILKATCDALLKLMEDKDEVSSNSSRSAMGAGRQAPDEHDKA